MKRRLAAAVAVCLLLVVAGGVYGQRRELERRWVAYRDPRLRAQAEAMLDAALEHDDKFVRIDAAGFLGRLGDPRGFSVLQRGASDFNPVARYSAVWRLVPYEERAVPLVETALHDEVPFVRDRAVYVLGQMHCRAARELLRRVWDERMPVGPAHVLDAMWTSMPEEAAAIIVAEIGAPDRLTRENALQAWLEQQGLLAQRGFRTERDAYNGYVRQVLEGLMRAGGDEGEWAARQLPQLRRLQRLERGPVHLLAMAQEERVRARRVARARRTRTALPDGLDVAAVRARLWSPDSSEREAAAWHLQRAPTPDVLRMVEERLRVEEVVGVREALASLLVQEDPPRAVPYLIRTIKEKSRYPLVDAARLMREHPDPALMPAYEAAIESEFAYVRLAAVHALSEVQHEDRLRLLARAFDDDMADIQVHAAAGYLMPW